MFSRFLLFFGAAGAGLCAAEAGRRRALRGGGLCAAEGFARRRPAGADLVHDSPQNLALSSTGTTSLGLKALGRRGLGARFLANPCSFVDGHHVFGVKGAAGEPDVVLHSPQNLALSSTGTMSLGPKALGRRGLGARFLAKPCSFVNGHHVFGAKGAAGIRSHHYKS